jgi:putative DNA primase/helicase
MQTIEAARGRWKEILPALGVAPKILSGVHQPCPLCGGTDRFRYTDPTGNGGYYCNQCGPGSGMQLLMKLHGWDFAKAAKEVDAIIGNLPKAKPMLPDKRVTSMAELKRIWIASRVIAPESPAGKYLVKRGLSIHGIKGSLRETIATFHPHEQVFPVMIAKFCDAHGNAAQIHQTFLTEDGGKAPVEPSRKFMRGVLPKGGAIRLSEAAEVMGVAEGIETALSAAKMFDMPVWSTTSALMMKFFDPPVGVKRLVIFGDNDTSYTGQAAAYALANRLVCEARAKGIERQVDVRIPETAGNDWNDELKGANDARITH